MEGWSRRPVTVVIEDGLFWAESLARSARVLGYETHICATCAETLAFFERTSADAILLDLGLPDGHGLELLAELRGRGVNAPVLVVSVFFSIEDVRKGYDLGASFMLKPGVGTEVMGFLLTQRLTVFGPTPEQVLAFASRIGLTEKETDVLAAGCVDRHQPTIAVVQRIKLDTVKEHIKSILDKSGASDFREVIEWVRAEPPPTARNFSDRNGCSTAKEMAEMTTPPRRRRDG